MKIMNKLNKKINFSYLCNIKNLNLNIINYLINFYK